MHKLSSLTLTPIWLSPEHLVKTAKFVLEGHELRHLPVISQGSAIGMVSYYSLENAAPSTQLRDLQLVPLASFQAHTTIRQIAADFVEQDLHEGAVFDGEEFLGLVTSNMLLKELGKGWDELTGLWWSDHLREWAMDQLSHKNEIAMIVLDLDDLQLYNKLYGFEAGDRVLKRISAEFLKLIDNDSDCLARLGGNQFLVATLRSEGEAKQLALRLQHSLLGAALRDLEGPISLTTGLSGGKRGKERDHLHPAAMVDSLINLAIKNCTEQKRVRPVSAVHEAAASPTREFSQVAEVSPPKVVSIPSGGSGAPEFLAVQESADGKREIQVVLRLDGRVVVGTQPASSERFEKAVANATCAALEIGFPDLSISIDDIATFIDPGGEQLYSVFGKLRNGEDVSSIAAAKPLQGGSAETVARATLEAFLSSKALSPRA